MLPYKNQLGYYEIRLESIGGLGANVSGKIIAQAGVDMGLNALNFASYGSEKKGTPVKSFIRFAESNKEIKINSPVVEPHLVAVFHENMIYTNPVIQGLNPEGIVIVNTEKTPDEMRDILKLPSGTIGCIDAIKISLEEKTRINMIMIGAVIKLLNFINIDIVKNVIVKTFGKKYPQTIESNVNGLIKGYEKVQIATFKNDGKYEPQLYKEERRPMGYDNATIGGTILEFANTIHKNNVTSRVGEIPIFHKEKCIHCGLCETTCPDYVFVWDKVIDGEKTKMINLGPDYQYCKGCLRCVNVCPVGALTVGIEREYNISEITAKHDFDIYKKWFKEGEMR